MKRDLAVAIAICSALAATEAWSAGDCDSLGPCAARTCRLDAQIARAKDKGQPRDVASLERQRSDMVHCSDEGLKEKRKMALQQAQGRIDSRRAELKKAEATQDPARITRAQRNLDNARKAYAEIERSPL
jgi:hypothetical protein